mmetsp:Transcript_6208/g.7117  ORF Transcript_6208/g.7117 Transcript_6208/m.7117 type:complete len:193 (+) Transcript_6208:43-621(+)
MTTSTPIKQYRRRSSCSTIALVVATAAMTSSTSAFTQCHNYHGSVIIPHRSTSLLLALIDGQDGISRGSAVLDRPLNLIDNPGLETHLNADNKLSCQEEKNNMDNDWELRLYDDKSKTWEEVADALVLVTGSSDPDAFKTMISANKNGFARVGNILCYEVAEMYNERLQKQGILSEIVQVISDGGDSNSEWE